MRCATAADKCCSGGPQLILCINDGVFVAESLRSQVRTALVSGELGMSVDQYVKMAVGACMSSGVVYDKALFTQAVNNTLAAACLA